MLDETGWGNINESLFLITTLLFDAFKGMKLDKPKN
jgi:hypothetical protein